MYSHLMRLIPLVLLAGCAHGVADPLPELKRQEEPRKVNLPSIREQVCAVSDIQPVRGGCKLYVLACEKTGTDYYLVCDQLPLGEITNPPDPIVAE